MRTFPFIALPVACTVALVGVGAENAFQRGCLYSKNLTTKLRVCGSEDPPEAATNGICRPQPIDYPEIRLLPSDWESTFFESWILQIALSEILNVPTSIEMGDHNLHLDFYHPDSPMDFPSSTANYRTSLENANLLNGECQTVNRNEENYQVCGHFNPESWGARKTDVQTMVSRGVVESPKALGMITQEGWFVPKFTAERDPSLLSYIGLQGEDNRRKLANRFRRPTSWTDYCSLASLNNCTTPDEVAQRAPLEEERDMMFAQDLYTGHFRATDKNNCILNPTTCTGYIADYPCGWSSPVPSQLHYLNISLDSEMESGGYDASQLVQIWHAANATKSDVVLYWWSQHLLYDEFFGTEAAFIPVTMPAATQECMESQPDAAHHCSPDFALRVGPPEAVCGEPPKNLHGVMSTSVYHQAIEGRCPARHSPSHAALMNFQLSELQMGEIFAHWNRLNNPREALCEWVSENMEYMEGFVPRTYPRTLEEKDEMAPLSYAAAITGLVVMLLVAMTLIIVHRNRRRRAIQYAQLEFLFLFLWGAAFIAIGAVVMSVPSSNASCIVAVWLINLGYLLELVPLIVKVGALLHVMRLGKRMQRVEIKRQMLFRVVALICFFMVVYLTVWTVMDPPKPTPEYELTDSVNDDGETVVLVQDVCSSNSQVWSYVSVVWNATLLLITTILAVQMRKLTVRGFNETPTLVLLVYSHLFFVLLRVVTYLLSSSVSGHTLARCLSLIFSADTAATIVIYFVPKFLAEDQLGGSSATIRISGGFKESTDWYSAKFSVGSNMRRAFSASCELGDQSDYDVERPSTRPRRNATAAKMDHRPAVDENASEKGSTRRNATVAVAGASKMDHCATVDDNARLRRNATAAKMDRCPVVDENASEKGSNRSDGKLNDEPSESQSSIQRRISIQISNWIVVDEEGEDGSSQHEDEHQEEQAEASLPTDSVSTDSDASEIAAMDSLMDEIERLQRTTTSLQLDNDFQASRLVALEEENARLRKIELFSALPINSATEGVPVPVSYCPTDLVPKAA